MINLEEVMLPVRDMIENDKFGHEGRYEYTGDERQRWRTDKLTKDETSINLRFDWALNSDVTSSSDEIADLMVSAFSMDLKDLIVNGDVSATSDVLLKMFSGEKVRGQKAVDVKILAAQLERMHSKTRKCFEYTLFIRPYIRWE